MEASQAGAGKVSSDDKESGIMGSKQLL